jgi:hypothetical protein
VRRARGAFVLHFAEQNLSGHGVKLRVARDGGPPRARGAPRRQCPSPGHWRSTAMKLDSAGLDVQKRRRNAGLSSSGESAPYGWSTPRRQVSDGSPARRHGRAVEEPPPSSSASSRRDGVMQRHHRERGSPPSEHERG